MLAPLVSYTWSRKQLRAARTRAALSTALVDLHSHIISFAAEDVSLPCPNVSIACA